MSTFLGRDTADVHFFYLELNCTSSGLTVLKVTVSDPAIPASLLSWYFTKKCATEKRGDLVVFINGEQATTHGKVEDRWKSPLVHITETVNVTMALRSGNQKVEHITVTSELNTVLRGMGAKGGFIDQPYTFLVSSSCEKDIAEGNVSVSIQIPPYNPIVLQWLFDCPLCDATNHSSHLPAIDIGTRLGLNDIISQGDLTVSWTAAPLSVREDEYSSSFFITGKEESGTGHITTNMRLMDPTLYCIKSGLYQKCILTYRCLNSGKADVTVTLPFPRMHQSLEFTYSKVCRKPKIIVREEVVTDGTGVTLCVVGVMVGVWLWACWKSQLAQGKPKLREIPI